MAIVELPHLIVESDFRIAAQGVDERRKCHRGRLQPMHHEQRCLVGIIGVEKINLWLSLHFGGPDHAHEPGLREPFSALFQLIAGANRIVRNLKPLATENDLIRLGSNLNSRSA